MAPQEPVNPPPPESEEALSSWQAFLARITRTRLTAGQTIIGLLILIGVGIALGLLLTQVWHYTRLDAGQPRLPVDDVLSITLEGTETVRVRVATSPATRTRPGHSSLPAFHQPVSPLYRVVARGSGQFVLRFDLSRLVSEDGPLDLYRWDADTTAWQFVPLSVDSAAGEWISDAGLGEYLVLRSSGSTPLVGAVAETTQPFTAPPAGALNWLLLDGMTVSALGTLDTAGLPDVSTSEGEHAVLPLVRGADGEAVTALLASDVAQQTQRAALADLLAGDEGFDGVVLDYGPLNSAQSGDFSALLDALAADLDGRGKQLAVRVPTPVLTSSGWDTGGYDWQRTGAVADVLIVTLPGLPDDYGPGGAVEGFLAWATTQVSRRRLVLATSALSVDDRGGQPASVPYDYALAPLGTVGVQIEAEEGGNALEPGQALHFDLAGQAFDIQYDEGNRLYHYDVYADDGKHHIWLVTPAALRARLDWLAQWQIGGLMVEGLLAPDGPPGALAAVQEFRASQSSTLDPALALGWTVRDASGAVLFETHTGLGTPLAWAPLEAGDYVISASVLGSNDGRLGAAAIHVDEEGGAVVTPEPPVSGQPSAGQPVAPQANTPEPVTIPEGMPAPVRPPGEAAFGRFELGGQVNQVIRQPDLMRQAGMTWAKFQLTYEPGKSPSSAWNFVEQGRSMGFKVLVSVVGGTKRPSEIDIAAFLEFLRGVAYYGPDAIEVWNEPNYYFEWPQGQVDGGAYVREMLAPAYNAIKEVNPNIMVISGALLPTGLYYGEGGCSAQGYGCDDWLFLQQMAQMGAANYMDCVGVHYNSGATPPSAGSGHPADPGYQHYSWYFGSMLNLYGGTFGHPVCFTELGYLSGEGYGNPPARYDWAKDTSVAEQAAWLAEAAQLSRQSGQVRLMIVWNVDFKYWGDDDPKAGYAILRPDGSCPACLALGNVMH